MPARKTPVKPYRQKKKPSVTKKTKNGRSSVRWLLIWLALTGVAMVSATAGALLAVSIQPTPLRQDPLSPQEEAVFNEDKSISQSSLQLPKLTRPVNILVLGTKVLTSDLKQPTEEELGYHALVNSFDGVSDTMLLVRFDPATEKVTVLSIPRDTRAYIEGYGVRKINAANEHGGAALTAKAVSNLLEDVPIDRYIRVNVQGVEKLIDALGGATVYVPKDMKYQDDSQHLYINLKEGKQHLDGEKALQFLRFRHDQYGDIGRVQRQQMLMRALVEQALKPSVLVRVPKIISVIQSHIDTNLSVEEVVALAGLAVKTDRSNIEMLMLPGEFNGDGHNDISYWLPNERRIREMMAQHFNQGFSIDEGSDRASLSVAIQDSTEDPEAVQALIDTLQEAGYQNVYVSKDWHEPLRVTRIVAQQGDDSSAAAVRSTLGFGDVRVESTGSIQSDVTIQLGKDWLQRQPTSQSEY